MIKKNEKSKADYNGTQYGTVRSSIGSRKNTFSLGFTRKIIFSHFEFIIIICTMLKHNETYRSRNWFWNDPCVTLMEPGNRLYDWIKNLGNLLAGFRTLFLIDDIISDVALDKRRQPFLDLAISGRHKGHSLFTNTGIHCHS